MNTTRSLIKYSFQKAAFTDAAAISHLAISSKSHWGYTKEFIDTCRQELTYTPQQISSKDWSFTKAETPDKKLLGFYALHLNKQQTELAALFIAPLHIGQGIGKSLLLDACKQAKKQGSKKLKIQSEPFALDFYLANGAKKIGELASLSIPGRFLPLLEITL